MNGMVDRWTKGTNYKKRCTVKKQRMNVEFAVLA